MASDAKRLLTPSEKRLVRALLARAGRTDLTEEWLDRAEVAPMDDGGMGSLRFYSSRMGRMGKQISELQFRDTDGVDVIASLNADDSGALFELDIWKVNFRPMIRIPDVL